MPKTAAASLSVVVGYRGDKTREVPCKWIGSNLAVHRPVLVTGEIKQRGWSITHIAMGKRAGLYEGLMRDAIDLAKAWDSVCDFSSCADMPLDRYGLWIHLEEWHRQLLQFTPPGGPR
jgi:hypothetical protein